MNKLALLVLTVISVKSYAYSAVTGTVGKVNSGLQSTDVYQIMCPRDAHAFGATVKDIAPSKIPRVYVQLVHGSELSLSQFDEKDSDQYTSNLVSMPNSPKATYVYVTKQSYSGRDLSNLGYETYTLNAYCVRYSFRVTSYAPASLKLIRNQ